MAPPKYVFGTGHIGPNSIENAQAFLDILRKNGINHLDTARVYPDSEKRLGELAAAKSFTIDTKAPTIGRKTLTRDSITAGITESLAQLKTDKVHTYYLHIPDPDTPIEETVDTIQELHRQGKFERFGLSNFLPEDVRKIHAYAKSKGGVVPTVYQGNYNAFARSVETTLFPVLQELGIAFYAYSPLAGGFFAKDPEKLAAGVAGGRFDATAFAGDLYNAIYNKPVFVDALREWREIAEEAGESAPMLAYRWAVWHAKLDVGKGDAVIIGASRPSQLEQTLEGLGRGPLAEGVVKKIEGLWKVVKGEAPVDNYNSYIKDVRY